MSWEAFGALGEVVGGIAAVILLAYIAYQIHQNSRMLEQNARATQAATYQANGEFWARAWTLLAQDPSLARIWRRGRDGEELDDDEIVRFESWLNVMFASLDDAYSQATPPRKRPRDTMRATLGRYWKTWRARHDSNV